MLNLRKKYIFIQTEKNKVIFEKIKALRLLAYDAGKSFEKNTKYSYAIDDIIDDLLENIKKDLELDNSVFKSEVSNDSLWLFEKYKQ